MSLFVFIIMVLFWKADGNHECFQAMIEEPCETTLQLTDWHRSVLYQTQPSDILVEDYFLPEGWYLIKVDPTRLSTKLTTSPPGHNHCGTMFPVWINGTYPSTAGDVAVVDVCTNVYDPCMFQHQICIKACDLGNGLFFSHYLTRTAGTKMAYCTDSQLPCGNGTSSVTGFPPCSYNYPSWKGTPTLKFMKENTGFSAVCSHSWELDNELDIRVQWLISGDHVYEEVYYPNGKEIKAKISDECSCKNCTSSYQCILNHRLNSYIRCIVSAKYRNDAVGAFSPGILSRELFAGLVVSPNVTVLHIDKSDEETKFAISSTVPIVGRMPSQSAKITITASTEGTSNLFESCYQQISNTQPAVYAVISEKDARGDVVSYINFEHDVTTFLLASRFWEKQGTLLPPLKVIIKDVDTASTCEAKGDPHYRTFDNSYFGIYRPGVYLLYQHQRLPIKIQTRVAACNGTACNCGVAVQVGHTLLIVDRCFGEEYVTFKQVDDELTVDVRMSDYHRITTREILQNNVRTPGTSIEFKDGNYFVHFPTGSVLKVEPYLSYFLNLYLTSSADDYNQITGLCGNFDGDYSNDGQFGPPSEEPYDCEKNICEPTFNEYQPKQPSLMFIESWGIHSMESIFEGNFNVDEAYDIHRYCSCRKNGDINCTFCNGREKLDCKDESRKKRSSVDVVDPDDLTSQYVFRPLNVDPNYVVNIPSFPTGSGLTEQKTRTLCTETLLTSITYSVCVNAVNNGSVAIDDIIEDCVFDIKVMDDVSIAKKTIATLQNRCETVMMKNPLYWTESEDGTLAPPNDLLDRICPGECNDGGICIKGVCECYAGLSGSDCSISLTEPPLVFGVLGDGICDIRSRPCHSALIHGDKFLNTEKLACHIQQVTVEENGLSLMKTEGVVVSGLYNTPQEVKCALPDSVVATRSEGITSQGFLISISNNGEKMSKSMALWLVFDSVCQVCVAQDGKCEVKTNSCRIQGKCFSGTSTNPSNSCQQCLPTISAAEWSIRQDGVENCDDNGSSTRYIIIGICVFLILFAVLAALIFRYRNESPRER